MSLGESFHDIQDKQLGFWRNKGEYLDTKKNSFKKVT